MNSPIEKTLLITGAAKRVGAEIAREFAAQRWNLVLHYRASAEAAEALAAELRTAHGITVTLAQADLADAGSLAHFWEGLPPVTALVHNAATFERDQLATMDPAMLQHQLQVNFTAPLLLTQGFMAQLPEGKKGSVVLLGDGTYGWSISPEFFSYSVSKQAMLGTLDLLASACAPRARVNLLQLAPTLPDTHYDAAMFERLAHHAPLHRTGAPEEVCAALRYLLEASGATGQILSLANGSHLQSYRPSA